MHRVFRGGDHRQFLLEAEPLDPECPTRRPPANVEQAHSLASLGDDNDGAGGEAGEFLRDAPKQQAGQLTATPPPDDDHFS